MKQTKVFFLEVALIPIMALAVGSRRLEITYILFEFPYLKFASNL